VIVTQVRAGRVARLVALMALTAVSPAFAQGAPQLKSAKAVPAAAAKPVQPPLIDRELLFGDPEISGSQLSPDGKLLAFLKPFKGTRNIWVKAVDEPFAAARPVTADTTRPIGSYFWSRDSRFILFAQDQGGDENFNVYAVKPADRPAAGSEVPVARNLTGLKRVRTEIFDVPKTDPDTIFAGFNDRDAAWHDLYKVKISTGERSLVRENTDRLTGWVFDLKGQLRLATRAAENGETQILRVDGESLTKVYTCSVFETCAPVRFHADGKRVYLATNKGTDVNLIRLVLFDPATMQEQLVESDPLNRVDLDNAWFSEATDVLVATSYIDDRPRVSFKNKAFEADYRLLEQKFAGRDIAVTSSTSDDGIWLTAASSDVDPGEVYIFNRKTKNLALQYRLREKLVRSWLAPMKPVRYASSDGLEIPGYLTLPKGLTPKNLPAIILPHGGPWARDVWGYDSYAQFLANRGYAVLQPNFRGSTGYGKKFLDAGNKQWGDKMQDDVTWGAKYLVAQGIADAKRIGIMGGSYGGYATLAGVAFTPDVYAAAVSLVGPSNLITLLDSIPPYWEAVRKTFYERMGDPTTPGGKAQLERQSPLNSADKIRTPLLVIQGANDPRVKKAESDQIVVALRDRGLPVEYLVAPDEGHGFARPVNNMAMLAAAERFLAQYLKGRYQETMTPEVAERLKAITVEVKTVEKPKRVVPVGVPNVAVDLREGSLSYLAKVELAGRTVELLQSVGVKSDGDTWIVTETSTRPGTTATDRTVLEKGSLVVRKRSVWQGPVTVQFDVKDHKAIGDIRMNEQVMPLNIDLGGPLFADGAGAYQVVAALPLAEGYTTRYRNLDLQTQKVTVQELAVVGSEPITVPAGTFETFVVELNSPDDGSKTTLWIDKAGHKMVRLQSVMPSQNGAVLTSELQK
jgi:dipeptidyl aminopeptidase/acylaminoacyl peptidase